MDQKILESMFDKSQQSGDDNKMKFTPEEADRFRKAFSDPKFREMFSEYMDEIQDPKYREETEAYISQLETEERVPEGKELIRPTAGFVAKTHKKSDSSTKEKLFLNIVQSDKIAPPSKVSTAKGDHWSIPYSLGPPHMEKDKKGENSTCFDCCFHPQALVYAEGEFKKLLVSTAMEGVEEYYKRAKQNIQLDRNFHVVKGINYKEGMIPSMLIATSSKDNWNTKDQSSPATKTANDTHQSSGKDSATKNGTEKISSGTKKPSNPPPSSHSDDEKMATSSPQKTTETTKLPTKSKSGTVIKKGFLVNNKNKKSEIYPEKIQTLRPRNDPGPSLLETSENKTSTMTTSNSSDTSNIDLSESLSKSLQLNSSDPVPKSDAPIITEKEFKAVATTRKVVEKPSEVVKPSPKGKSKVVEKSEETVTEQYPLTPEVIVKHRDESSMGDFQGMSIQSSRPKELIYEIQLPLVSAPSKINLDVSERRLCLTYLEKYKLDMKLPYPIDDKKGKAAYEKSKKVLKVTLPVIPDTVTTKPRQVIETETSEKEELNDSKVEELQKATTEVEKKEPTPPRMTTRSQAEKAHNRWVDKQPSTSTHPSSASTTNEEEEERKKFYEEVKQKAEQARLEALSKPVKTASTTTTTTKTTKKKASEEISEIMKDEEGEKQGDNHINKEEYISSVKFTGRKNGYVFRIGAKGLGYYLDQQPGQSQTTPTSTSSTSPTTATVSKDNGDNKIKKMEYQLPPFEIRQTKGAISMIFQVPAIIKTSVTITTISSYHLQVTFAALSETNRTEYGISLKMNQKYCDNGIDTTKITFDVAGKNMVLILLKKQEMLYGLDTTSTSDWITSEPLITTISTSNDQTLKEQKVEESRSPEVPGVSSQMTTPTATEVEKKKKETKTTTKTSSVKNMASEAFKSTVATLQFSTDFISELD